MEKRRFISACLFSIIVISLMRSAVSAEPAHVESFLSMQMGVERLEYEENEPVNNLSSRSEVENVVVGIDGVYALPSFFAGIKAVFPLLSDESGERWNQGGSLFQTNTLKHEWARLDTFIGYPLSALFIPFGGVRYSRVEQDRSNFVVLGNPAAGSAREKVTSWSLFFGVMGRPPLDQNWTLSYRIAFFHPVDLKVTNSALPGFRASEKDGYGLELEAGIFRTLSDTMGVEISAYGGRTHWEGSDFKAFPGGLAKWPENDTTYLGGAIHLRFTL